MSEDTKKPKAVRKPKKDLQLAVEVDDQASKKGWWGPFTGISLTLAIYLFSQLFGVLILNLYALSRGIKHQALSDWLNNSIGAQFAYAVLALGFAVFVLRKFLKRRNKSFKDLGLVAPRFRDLGYVIVGFIVYIILFVIATTLVKNFYHQFNVDQQQAIGFQAANNSFQLLLAFVSLVVLPPIVEELLFRGFLYTGLKKAMPIVWAALVTSALFAAPHLLETTGGGLLWIAGVDTFVLSLVLIYVREKTGSLAASIGLHALKNGLAFVTLFVLHQR